MSAVRPVLSASATPVARAFRLDSDYFRVQPQRAAEALEQRDHAGHQRVGATLGEPDPASAFQRVDQRIDRAGRKGIAPTRSVWKENACRRYGSLMKRDTTL